MRAHPLDEAAAAALISRYRAQNGLGPVTLDRRLVAMARTQAGAMASAGVLSHEVAGRLFIAARRGGPRSRDGR